MLSTTTEQAVSMFLYCALHSGPCVIGSWATLPFLTTESIYVYVYIQRSKNLSFKAVEYSCRIMEAVFLVKETQNAVSELQAAQFEVLIFPIIYRDLQRIVK